MRFDRDSRDLIVEIRLTKDGGYKSATSGTVDVTDQLGLVLSSENYEPRVGSPAFEECGVLNSELKTSVTSLSELKSIAEVASGDDIEPVRLKGVV